MLRTDQRKVDFGWIVPCKGMKNFGLWLDSFKENKSMFIDFLKDQNPKEYNQAVHTSLLLAAQRGEFLKMQTDLRRLKNSGFEGDSLIEELNKRYRQHRAAEREETKAWLRKIHRKKEETLYVTLQRLERCLESCELVGYEPSNEEKNEALKRCCWNQEWTQIWFFGSLMDCKEADGIQIKVGI